MGNIAVALIQRALDVSPELAGARLRVRVRSGRLTISGLVDSLRQKRTALLVAREISFGERFVDRVEVTPVLECDDREIAAELLTQLSWEPELAQAIVHVAGPAFDAGARIPFPKPSARLAFWIEDGVVRVSGIAADALRRGLAEGIAWSITGVRDVRTLFRALPARPDAEAVAIACARRLIARDRELGECASLIDAWISNGELTLSGIVPSWQERERAEHDAWAVEGVRSVAVELQILRTSPGRRHGDLFFHPAARDEERVACGDEDVAVRLLDDGGIAAAAELDRHDEGRAARVLKGIHEDVRSDPGIAQLLGPAPDEVVEDPR